MDRLPKVLVVGQRFHRVGGGGITLSNLFAGWDKDKIFSLPLQSGVSESDVCDNVFELGAGNRKHFGFISISNKKSISIDSSETNHSTVLSVNQSGTLCSLKNKKSKLKSFLNSILILSGLIELKSIYRIDDALEHWLDSIDPEVVYAQYSTLSGMLFILDLVRYLNKPLVIHIMDDWISTYPDNGNSNALTNWVARHCFRKIVKKAEVRIAISEAMATEYNERYGRSFAYLNNPINPNLYRVSATKTLNDVCNNRIAYFGRIGRANKRVIRWFCETIESTHYFFDIYSPDGDLLSGLHYERSHIESYVDHSMIPAVMASYDLLLLPFDFDEDSYKFAKYSMPTKIGEYLMSGVPVLLIAPKGIAVESYLRSREASFILTNLQKDDLLSVIDEALYKSDKRDRLLSCAKACAMEDFSIAVIKGRFTSLIKSLV